MNNTTAISVSEWLTTPTMTTAITDIINSTETLATTVSLMVNSTGTPMDTNMTPSPVSDDTYHACASVENCLWAIFSPIIFLVGIFGNILNIFILTRLKFCQNTTLSLLFALAFADMTVLIVGLTRYWIRATFNTDIRDVSGFSCKFSLFLIYFSMHMSSWILVQVSFVRFVKTALLDNRHRTIRQLVSMKNSMITLCIITVFFTALDFHYFFTNGITEDGCDSLSEEILFFEEFVFTYVDLVMLVIVPGILMLILNFGIIRQIRKLKINKRNSTGSNGSVKSSSRVGKQAFSKMTKMLVFTSFYFIVASLPICIYFIVDSYVRPGSSEEVEMKLDLANSVVYLFQFTHFAINFYFYTATNKRFRNELTKLGKNARTIMFTAVVTSDQSGTDVAMDHHHRVSSRSGTADS